MPRDANGNYTKPNSPVSAGETILASYENSNTDDQAVEFTDSLSRSGKGAMLSALKLTDSGLIFENENNSGLRRNATGDVRLDVLSGAGLILGQNLLNGVRVGKVDKDTSLAALIADIGSSVVDLFLFPEDWPVASNLTIPANIRLIFPRGATISPATGVVVNIEGDIQAGLFQIFAGEGTFTGFAGIAEALPQWWGAVPIAANNSSASTQKALTAIGSNNKIRFTSGTWLLNNIDLTHRDMDVVCDDRAFFTASDNATDIFNISGQRRMNFIGGHFLKARRVFSTIGLPSVAYCRFERLRFKPALASDIGAAFYGEAYVGNTFLECQFGWDSVQDGIDTCVDFLATQTSQTNINRFISCLFMNFKDFGVRFRESDYAKSGNVFYGCWFEDSNGTAVEAGRATFALQFHGCYLERIGNASNVPIKLTNARSVSFNDCVIASYNAGITAWIDCNASELHANNNHVSVNAFPFVAFSNLAAKVDLLDSVIIDLAVGDYKTRLFSVDSDASEEFVNWNIPRSSTQTTGDNAIQENKPYSRTYTNGYLRHGCLPVNLAADSTWYDVARLNIKGASGSTAFRVTVEMETLSQGLAAAARFIEVFVIRNGSTVTVNSIRNENVGASLELQVVPDGSNAKVQARRIGGTLTVATPIIQVYQADEDIKQFRVSISDP